VSLAAAAAFVCRAAAPERPRQRAPSETRRPTPRPREDEIKSRDPDPTSATVHDRDSASPGPHPVHESRRPPLVRGRADLYRLCLAPTLPSTSVRPRVHDNPNSSSSSDLHAAAMTPAPPRLRPAAPCTAV